jgi:cytosine/adenosine deaminase-related metal-dependent hydrolase
MIRYVSDWVVPVTAPPLSPGWVDVERGRILEVGSADPGGVPASSVRELGATAIMPALVNAHTHLELSVLKGKVPPAATMPEWVGRLLKRRAEIGVLTEAPIGEALSEVRASGTGLLGDIGNTTIAAPSLSQADMPVRLFREVVAFPSEASGEAVGTAIDDLRHTRETYGLAAGIAAHAPYSVGVSAFAALDAAAREVGGLVRCIHLAESPEELEFLRSGTGAWRTLLENLGRWEENWVAPQCGPVEFLERMRWLQPGGIVVHGVQLTDDELVRLADLDVTLVTCPRSNVWTGVGEPPIERFFRSGVRLAVGTDSLASAPDLNLFSELALMRRLAPTVPGRRLLECATGHGARALGFAGECGALVPGARAPIAVSVPARLDDVEEYLVSGIQPEQVDWLTGWTRAE